MMRRLIVLAVVCLIVSGAAWTHAIGDTGEQGSGPAWTSPAARTLRLVGPAPDTPEQPDFQNNLDCSEATYHLTSNSDMQAGCFTPTAYGWVNPDNDFVIFNGTDEALPLKTYTAHQILTPWPGALDTLALTPLSTGGSSIALYKNLPADLQDERNITAQLTAKQVTAPPDMQFTDSSGQPLIVNAQTIAFSDNGSWLVAEDLNGSFVRVNLATLDIVAFAPSFGSSGSPALLKSQVAISEDGRYIAIENTAAASFKVYDLAACTGTTKNLQPLGCATYDYWPFIHEQIPAMGSITHVRFMTDSLLTFNAPSGNTLNNYELAPASSITTLIDYLALGDSYTSGEGAFDYLAGTDAGEDVCHLSIHSYPLLIANQLFSSGHSVACSGARIQDVLPGQPNNYRGQVAGGIPRSERPDDNAARILADFTPGYLAQQDFVKHYQPGVTTVSVGGDDIGFGDMIQNCVEPHISLHLSDGTCYDTYEDRLELKGVIDRTVSKWAALYRRLQADSPESRLYVIGYPQIAVDSGSCALNVHLSRSELEFSEEVVDYLNGAVQQAASKAGVTYVDISQALSGHRLCETASYNVAVNGLTAGSDGGPLGLKVFGKESYHPNALGQALIAAAIIKQSHNLQVIAAPSSPKENDSQTLLNVPRNGRPVNTVTPANYLANRVIDRGGAVAVHLDGTGVGLRGSSTYIIRLDGPTGTSLGTLTADQNADLTGVVTVPGNTSPGGHTIDITGAGQTDEPVDITQPIYVTVSSDDADGDGIPDNVDSCPGAMNSGRDDDSDGTDDVCDGYIGPPSTNNDIGGDGITTTTGVAGNPPTSNNVAPSPQPVNNLPAQPNDVQTSSKADIVDQLSGITLVSILPPAKSVQFSGKVIAFTSALGGTKGIHSTAPLAGKSSSATSLATTSDFAAVSATKRVITKQHTVTSNRSPRLPVVSFIPSLSRAYFLVSLALLLLLLCWLARRLRRLLEEHGCSGPPSGDQTAKQRYWLSPEVTQKPLPTLNVFSGCRERCASCTIMSMLWVRKGVVQLLSLVLFVALLTGALAISTTIAFSHPAKLEKWLTQSNLYSSFVNNAIKQANASANNGGQSSGGVSLTDVAVQQAAQAAFSPALLQQDVNTFLDSNYAWLEGKTTTPSFTIDLSGAKESFAQKVGQYVQGRLSSLPVCTTAQALALSQTTTDPLSLTCRPANLNPVAAGTQVTQQLETNSGFLSNPVITANSINPNGSGSQPYYQKISFAPRVYRAASDLPWALGALAVLSCIGIIFIAPRKRKGLRRIGIVALEVGILLVAAKFVTDIAFRKVEAKVFNNVSVGPLQQSLTSFAHRAETQLVDVNMYFGIGFIVLATLIIATLLFTRNRTGKIPKADSTAGGSNQPAVPTSESSDATGANTTVPPKPDAPRPKRPQRLIQ